MTNRKTTRRALVLSLLSLLVCCSMLVGTTFAWFTDSVQTGNNKIVAGNLDVELTHTSASVKTAESVAGSTALFVDENGKQILWEPGVVVWENLTVSNEGTLALKYTMSVNFTNENTVDGYGLSKALKVAVVEPIEAGASREDVLKAVAGKGESLASFEKSGKLLPKDSDLDVTGADEYAKTYGIVIWWEPSAEDNNWNVNNGKQVSDFAETKKNELHIDLGIELFATQLEAEDDSFGDDYDESAVYADVTVTTAAELEAALAAGKKIIGVSGKITLTKGLNASDVILVGASSDAAIDFNTHNLGGSGTITYRNLKLTTQSLPYAPENGERYGWYGGIDYLGHAVANYEGCEISGVFTTYSATVNIDGCTFLPYVQGTEEFYHIFVYGSKTVNVENSTFYYGDRAIKIYNEGGVKDVVFNISDSTFKADESFKEVNKALINVDASLMNSVQLNVNNIVVDEKLKGADVYSDDANKVTATVDGVVVSAKVATQTDLNNALSSGDDVAVELEAGTYKMPSTGAAKEITISGTKDTVIDNTLGSYLESAVVSFEGVTIKGSTGKANGNGSDYAALYSPNVTYTNCTFDGPFRVGRDGATFIGCTFTNLGNDYVWTYGNDCTFIGCTFESEGKALLIYSDGGGEVAKVTVKDCTFNATKGAKAGAIANQNCAAIEIDNYGNGVDLTTSGNTYGSDFSGEWRIKSYSAAKPAVIVNGATYTTIAIDGKTMTIDADKNVTVQ